MAIQTKITDDGVKQESSPASSMSVEVPVSYRSGQAPINTLTSGSYSAIVPGFYYVSGAAASGSLFTVPNPASFPGAELSLVEVGQNQVVLSGAYAGRTFALTNGTSFGSIMVLPTAGYVSLKSSGASWCVAAQSGSLSVYT